MESALIAGDLAPLKPSERMSYYRAVCESLKLNPLTKPFEYLALDGKLVLYTKRDGTDQLAANHKLTRKIISRELMDGGTLYVVTARATMPDGREEESIGAVSLVKEDGQWKTAQSGKRYFESTGKLLPLKPDEKANALMKAETKAKRRVTLSICGLGFIDESELETMPHARVVSVEEAHTVEKIETPPPPPQTQQASAPPSSPAAPTNGGGKSGPASAPPPEKPAEDPEVQKLYAECKKDGRFDKFAFVKVAHDLKRDIEELCGNDGPYYEVLGGFKMKGFGPADYDAIPGDMRRKVNQSAAVIKALYLKLRVIEASTFADQGNAEPAGETTDDAAAAAAAAFAEEANNV